MFDYESESELIQGLRERRKALKLSLKRERDSLEQTKIKLEHARKAQEVLQSLAQSVQQKAHERIARVVTTCLQTVFPDDPYEFQIRFERKRGRTEARLIFVRDGLEVSPLSASGGGVVDVAAFALRVACLSLHRPRLSRLLVLDEPFRFVSAQHHDAIRIMLKTLAKEMGIQIVMVTHNANLVTGKVIEV